MTNTPDRLMELADQHIEIEESDNLGTGRTKLV